MTRNKAGTISIKHKHPLGCTDFIRQPGHLIIWRSGCISQSKQHSIVCHIIEDIGRSIINHSLQISRAIVQ